MEKVQNASASTASETGLIIAVCVLGTLVAVIVVFAVMALVYMRFCWYDKKTLRRWVAHRGGNNRERLEMAELTGTNCQFGSDLMPSNRTGASENLGIRSPNPQQVPALRCPADFSPSPPFPCQPMMATQTKIGSRDRMPSPHCLHGGTSHRAKISFHDETTSEDDDENDRRCVNSSVKRKGDYEQLPSCSPKMVRACCSRSSSKVESIYPASSKDSTIIPKPNSSSKKKPARTIKNAAACCSLNRSNRMFMGNRSSSQKISRHMYSKIKSREEDLRHKHKRPECRHVSNQNMSHVARSGRAVCCNYDNRRQMCMTTKHNSENRDSCLESIPLASSSRNTSVEYFCSLPLNKHKPSVIYSKVENHSDPQAINHRISEIQGKQQGSRGAPKCSVSSAELPTICVVPSSASVTNINTLSQSTRSLQVKTANTVHLQKSASISGADQCHPGLRTLSPGTSISAGGTDRGVLLPPSSPPSLLLQNTSNQSSIQSVRPQVTPSTSPLRGGVDESKYDLPDTSYDEQIYGSKHDLQVVGLTPATDISQSTCTSIPYLSRKYSNASLFGTDTPQAASLSWDHLTPSPVYNEDFDLPTFNETPRTQIRDLNEYTNTDSLCNSRPNTPWSRNHQTSIDFSMSDSFHLCTKLEKDYDLRAYPNVQLNCSTRVATNLNPAVSVSDLESLSSVDRTLLNTSARKLDISVKGTCKRTQGSSNLNPVVLNDDFESIYVDRTILGTTAKRLDIPVKGTCQRTQGSSNSNPIVLTDDFESISVDRTILGTTAKRLDIPVKRTNINDKIRDINIEEK